MKLTHALLSVSVAVVLGLGCATPIRVDSGRIKAKTFTFVDMRTHATPEYAEQRAPVHAMIQDAITQALEDKGLGKVGSGADLVVAYLLIINDNTSTESVNDFFGYGRDATPLVEKAHEKLTLENKNPNAFEEGTLLIDVIDGASHKLLWRNFVVGDIHRDATDEERRQRIQAAVSDLLLTLRVAE